MTSRKRHIIEYGLFSLLSVSFLILFIVFSGNKYLLKVLSGLVSSLYVIWGIIHSAYEGRLTPAIVFEYILFGVFAFLLLFVALSFE